MSEAASGSSRPTQRLRHTRRRRIPRRAIPLLYRLLRASRLWPFVLLSAPGLRLLAWRHGDRAAPLSAILLLRRLSAGRDPLMPTPRPRPASEVQDRSLRELLGELLGERRLDEWSLGPATIDALAQAWRARPPELAIEFGSGLSTLCLALLAREAPASLGSRVLAIEQSERHADETRASLASAGLAEYAQVVHAPLEPRGWDSVTRSTYRLPADLAELIGRRRAGLVLVDGPAAERGARVATLPLVRSWLVEGACVLLDDALRDGELDVARRWQASGWVEVQGIRLVDKGVLEAVTRSSP